MENVYLTQIKNVLPRIFSLLDHDPTNKSYGCADRYWWSWKLTDFANGTFQGMAHGFARLLAHNLLPELIIKDSILHKIDIIFNGTKSIIRANGSLEEAFPFENSYCVTALVSYDLISCVMLIENHIDSSKKSTYIKIIEPMITFLKNNNETHAFISNHLATASVALYKWNILTGENDDKIANKLLNKILKHQSDEGWFLEYEGADPGYQSLCTYYLADLHYHRPDLNLIEPLRRSIQFLTYFIHPDGSFGGLYGSRNTRFYYPAGFEILAEQIVEAKMIAATMRNSIQGFKVVTLVCMDDPNLIPMFNAYCFAATSKNLIAESINIPCQSTKVWQKTFTKAGLLIGKGREHYTIISLHKGGVCYHFNKLETMINTGIIVENPAGDRFSTQAYQPQQHWEIKDNHIIINTPLTSLTRIMPTPFKFLILRLLCLTLMRVNSLNKIIKLSLVKLLITNKKSIPVFNIRTIKLGNKIEITDNLQQNHNEQFKILSGINNYSSIHMASQGYWQIQDEYQYDPKT